MAKLILGAYIGRPMLHRRRCFEVYYRFDSMSALSDARLLLKRQSQISQLEEKKVGRETEGESLDGDEKSIGLAQNTRGSFTDEEVENLVYLVVKRAESKGKKVTEVGDEEADEA